MPLYAYEAVDKNGKKTKATVEGADEKTVKAEIQAAGLIPLSIQQTAKRDGSGFARGVSAKDLLRFTQELGNLIESGLPLDRALFILSEHTDRPGMKEIVKDLFVNLQKGQSLSQAMSRHEIFPKLYVNMVKAGETGGIMEPVIKRLATFLELSASFREEIINALIYPLILTGVGGVSIVVLMVYVIPKFTQIFADMGQALPGPTMALVAISGIISRFWWLIILVVSIAVLGMRSYIETSEGRLAFDGLKLKIPVLKEVHMRFVVTRFTRTLGTLLQSGVPILEAIRISRDVVGNEVISEKLAVLEAGVKQGKGVSGPLVESGVFPPLVAHMIAVGEEAGRLEDTFISVAERFEFEGRTYVKRVVTLIEPLIIVVLGLVVLFIILSLLMAILGINDLPM